MGPAIARPFVTTFGETWLLDYRFIIGEVSFVLQTVHLRVYLVAIASGCIVYM